VQSKNVLVTGAAGAIGRAAAAALVDAGHAVRGFDRVPMPDLTDSVVADLTDVTAVNAAVAGMDTVVHLAATPDDADFQEHLLPNNVVGLYNVMDAARETQVSRLVVTSTVQVVWGLRQYGESATIRVEDGTAPRNHYACTKVFAEAMGEMYAHRFGMSVIVVRPGWLPREQRHVDAIAASETAQAIYFSPPDAGRFFRCAVEAEDVPFAVVFAASRSGGEDPLDLEPARRHLGYVPQDTWPDNSPHPVPSGADA
jgi:uronate dehydrogenase